MPVGQCLEGMWPSPFGVAKQLDLDFNCLYRKSRPEYLLHVVPQKYWPDLHSFLLVAAWNDGRAAGQH